jgi:ATP-dependent Clp protease ATP-binding subunit ClpC
MLERFTRRAKLVLSYAQDEAHRFNHPYVGTEHLLLGLIRDRGGLAGKVLNDLGVKYRQARNAVEFIVGHGELSGRSETLELTATAKKVMEYALEEARTLNHQYVGTEHMLLGLLRNGEGVAIGVLQQLGVAPEQVRQEVLNAIGPGVDDRVGLPEIAGQSNAKRSELMSTSDEIAQAVRWRRSRVPYLLLTGLLLACGYIMWLRRKLVAARQRGDMYRDIAAALDRENTAQRTGI